MVLPKTMRIKGHKSFNYLQKAGIRFHSSSMMLRIIDSYTVKSRKYFFPAKTDSCKCAVAISCKVSKKAIVRNRLRRLLHNHLRLRLESRNEHSNKLALITLKQSSTLEEDVPLLNECDQLLKEAGLLS